MFYRIFIFGRQVDSAFGNVYLISISMINDHDKGIEDVSRLLAPEYDAKSNFYFLGH